MKDQCVLITGGATGIGEALVRAFAEQGAKVFFCDIEEEAGQQLADEVGGPVHFTRVDLTEEDEVVSWIQGIAKQEGTIRVLLNNAAQDTRVPLQETTMERWDQLTKVNLRAAYLCIQQAAPYMKNNNASIINFGSVTFQLGEAGLSAYVTAKGAIVAMSRSLARELGPDHIRVNTLSPGWVMTEKQLRLYVNDEVKERIFKAQCIPTLIESNEIALVALFLASNTSRAITGQNIAVNRGWT
ncbi:MAG: SDR family oxidoreductase, partial [Rhodothermaceae bacterium]|nr:SDR family oxidoreductase [Rhodothermaceae bacterium]